MTSCGSIWGSVRRLARLQRRLAAQLLSPANASTPSRCRGLKETAACWPPCSLQLPQKRPRPPRQ
jgi:hypothetical protein